MQKTVLIVALAACSTAFAQESDTVQRSSSPRGVRIQGDTMISAGAQNTNVVASGEGNVAKTATGAVKSGTQIQGNTRINANASKLDALATGKNSAAANDVGTVGGK